MTNCNIIIPTYQRPAYLRRILDYYNDYGEDFKIIVADSSSDDIKAINKETISSTSKLDIKYLDDYPAKINPIGKIADAVNYVKTEYCVMCGDDDFVTPDGIRQSVDFLEKNPDFTVAHGYYIYFYLKIDERGNQQFYWKPLYSHESIIFPDAKVRLNYLLSNWTQATFYAVHRTDFLKMIFDEAARFANNDLFGELLPLMLTLIYGKIKCLDVCYGAHEALFTGRGLLMRLKDSIKAGTYNETYARVRDCSSAHLNKQAQLDIKESKKAVDKAMSACIKNFYPKPILMNKIRDILDYLRLPDWMDKGISSLYRKLFLRLYRKLFLRRSSNLLLFTDIPPSSEYYDGFNEVRLHVLSHSKENSE